MYCDVGVNDDGLSHSFTEYQSVFLLTTYRSVLFLR